MTTLMKNSLFSVVGAVQLLRASDAKAATDTYIATHSPSSTEWTNNFVLQQFNPEQGSLSGVYIQTSYDVNFSGTVQNNGLSTQTFTYQGLSFLNVTLPGTLGHLYADAFGPILGYTLIRGMSVPYSGNASSSVNQTYTSTGNMAWFIGAGTLTLPGFTYGTLGILSGGSGISATLGATAGATVEIQYNYEPVPEPGSLALLALGGGVMLLRKRR
jgi:hypothetical protein